MGARAFYRAIRASQLYLAIRCLAHLEPGISLRASDNARKALHTHTHTGNQTGSFQFNPRFNLCVFVCATFAFIQLARARLALASSIRRASKLSSSRPPCKRIQVEVEGPSEGEHAQANNSAGLRSFYLLASTEASTEAAAAVATQARRNLPGLATLIPSRRLRSPKPAKLERGE